MGANTKVLNPATQDHSFGTVPALTLARKNQSPIITLAAPINLKEGKHFGPNSGFGVQHIWAEHSVEILAAGFGGSLMFPRMSRKSSTRRLCSILKTGPAQRPGLTPSAS